MHFRSEKSAYIQKKIVKIVPLQSRSHKQKHLKILKQTIKKFRAFREITFYVKSILSCHEVANSFHDTKKNCQSCARAR